MLTSREDVWPWGRMPVLLCKCCGQPGANSSFDISCLAAWAVALKSRRRRLQVQPKLSDLVLGLRASCGKERTGFPQGDADQPAEIPHPVDPETWKRCYTFILTCSRTRSDTIWRNLYWLHAGTLPRLLPGRECSKAISLPQGTQGGG